MSIYTTLDIAKLWHVSRNKVLDWIRSGDLEAFNVSSRPGQKPTYRVTQEQLESFQTRRATIIKKPTHRSRCPKPTKRWV